MIFISCVKISLFKFHIKFEKEKKKRRKKKKEKRKNRVSKEKGENLEGI